MDKTCNAPTYTHPYRSHHITTDFITAPSAPKLSTSITNENLQKSLILQSPSPPAINIAQTSINIRRSYKVPSLFLVHLALISAQISFGGGSVIGALGLPATNPVLFALIRESIAGPLLCIIAFIVDHKLPKFTDLKLFVLPGIALFINQLCFIIGLKLSSGITASAWQPSQGILAIVYGYCFRTEKHMDIYKIFGILISFAGASFMVLYGNNHSTSGNNSIWGIIGGSVFFFINCSATVLYLTLAKPVLKKYGSSTVTGYSYLMASVSMVVTAVIVANVQPLLHFICSDCGDEAWNVPTVTIYALIYWILMPSLLSYLCITWATKYVPPSVNVAYTVLQPLTAVVASEILLLSKISPKCSIDSTDNSSKCVYGVNWNDLGAVGIGLGLLIVIYGSRKYEKERMRESYVEDDESEIPVKY